MNDQATQPAASTASLELRTEASDHIAAVAIRVLSGELNVLGLRSGMTEAGALAAALSAILSGGR